MTFIIRVPLNARRNIGISKAVNMLVMPYPIIYNVFKIKYTFPPAQRWFHLMLKYRFHETNPKQIILHGRANPATFIKYLK